MRYHIDTIPVWEAMEQHSECPLCALRRKTERLLVERSLGASVMSPDTRVRVNEAGFCAQHQVMMFNFPGGNKLGQGLMMLSHLQTLRPKAAKALQAGARVDGRGRNPFAALMQDRNTARPDGGSGLGQLIAGCVICEELESQSRRQTASLLHLWKTEPAFQRAFLASKGLCLPHTDAALGMAGELLSGEKLDGFVKAAGQLLEASLQRLEEELAWFTQKFDYRNAQQPWGDSRDALERAASKLRGWCLGNEPMQDETRA